MSLTKWTRHCVLATGGNDNDDPNSTNFLFTIKDTKLYVPVVPLSAQDNQKLSKIFIKRFERSVSWNEYKTKNENKSTKIKYRYFLKSNFVGVNRLLASGYANQDNNSKRFKSQRYYSPKVIIKTYNAIISESTFMTKQLILI